MNRLDAYDLTRIEHLAEEIIRQVGFLRRNGACDEIRFGFIHLNAVDLQNRARRAFRRWEREHP